MIKQSSDWLFITRGDRGKWPLEGRACIVMKLKVFSQKLIARQPILQTIIHMKNNSTSRIVVYLFVSFPGLTDLRFTQCWVRRQRVKPFPHACICCHTCKCNFTRRSPRSEFGYLKNKIKIKVCHVPKITWNKKILKQEQRSKHWTGKQHSSKSR